LFYTAYRTSSQAKSLNKGIVPIEFNDEFHLKEITDVKRVSVADEII
jgi:hypothetical protein